MQALEEGLDKSAAACRRGWLARRRRCRPPQERCVTRGSGRALGSVGCALTDRSPGVQSSDAEGLLEAERSRSAELEAELQELGTSLRAAEEESRALAVRVSQLEQENAQVSMLRSQDLLPVDSF